MTIPARNRPVLRSVGKIGFMSVPPQIYNCVVGSISIVMARLLAGRTWTNKGHQDKSVNVEFCPSAGPRSSGEKDSVIFRFLGFAWRHLLPKICHDVLYSAFSGEIDSLAARLNASVAPNAVAWKTWNVSIFDGFSRIVRSHFHLLIRWLWSGQSSVISTRLLASL